MSRERFNDLNVFGNALREALGLEPLYEDGRMHVKERSEAVRFAPADYSLEGQGFSQPRRGR